eukprot:Lankesteria_metandrocarpae@DN1806_c0_g1_i1.p1
MESLCEPLVQPQKPRDENYHRVVFSDSSPSEDTCYNEHGHYSISTHAAGETTLLPDTADFAGAGLSRILRAQSTKMFTHLDEHTSQSRSIDVRARCQRMLSDVKPTGTEVYRMKDKPTGVVAVAVIPRFSKLPSRRRSMKFQGKLRRHTPAYDEKHDVRRAVSADTRKVESEARAAQVLGVREDDDQFDDWSVKSNASLVLDVEGELDEQDRLQIIADDEAALNRGTQWLFSISVLLLSLLLAFGILCILNSWVLPFLANSTVH